MVIGVNCSFRSYGGCGLRVSLARTPLVLQRASLRNRPTKLLFRVFSDQASVMRVVRKTIDNGRNMTCCHNVKAP
ncbi:hypothetical protein HBI56_073160 [Parastagonospora nodorum]|uniref:Uncharacterized protein n=1 Tax=Phaeosphaeria nodorum (strain SN15 / ATCC MYA-4574 / FGSC 10173) TaxID=321614 RepID=A0A7U2EWS3_PHANO|nr:hypothetical protein HBH56_171830 [Parastagonospora nodorum]QRC94556.1 hypothetical protein JI435_406020 [Parastagonospora nodorum SN15]KAH3928311.1 hypothetical protein HBH54_140390 [Parastagonospora nodorum]KAH3945287.1 hypothetical protein HBH53_145710 [Parastagonospora nodorum]KAH3984125.1 hypothetical protein HBH52_058480 [Parastagonospora nodorum]